MNRDLLAALIRADARDQFQRFCERMEWPQVRPHFRTEDERWSLAAPRFVPAHLELIARAVQRLVSGEISRAAFFMPPGSAKSTLLSGLALPWAMGREPEYRAMLASYASTVVRAWSRRARDVTRTEAFKTLFGVAPNPELDSVDHWGLSNGSEFYAVTFDGQITSKRAKGLVIDDPIKGRKEARSPVVLKRTREAYEDELLPRLIPGGFVAAVFTRYSRLDMASWTLGEDYDGRSGFVRGLDGEEWLCLCLPAIAEREDDPLGRAPGEGLWPQRFPLSHWAPFQTVNRTWASLYQQRPAPEGGLLFRREWLRPCKPSDIPRDAIRYRAWDFAATEDHEAPGADYTCGLRLARAGMRLFVEDVIYARASPGAVDRLVQETARADGPGVRVSIPQDPGQAGKDQAGRRKALAHRGGARHVEATPELGKKTERAFQAAAEAEKGNLYVLQDAPWRPQFEASLCEFPVGAHDDDVDALSRACNALLKLASVGQVKVRVG